ncbi:MAG: hypothetical protein EOM34_12105 [Clostridia bacterium]|nr:hypothetical protein [Lachnospiraceae bacterium]NCC01397.1 hypothetical protein [Clostridia bacterium]NCD03220.1 hypothetical protein [Clostridia bacterium]
MAKKIKKSTIAEAQKRRKNILEFYYMTPEDTDAKELTGLIKSVEEEKVDVWPALNLMEVVLDNDSLIFQDGRECFIDPLDQEFIEKHQIKMIYAVSYEEEDSAKARRVIRDIMEVKGGFLCSDTEDFEPIYDLKSILNI